jgi:hypothetical protein
MNAGPPFGVRLIVRTGALMNDDAKHIGPDPHQATIYVPFWIPQANW